MISVCVPVLKRYDLLRKMILSLNESTVPLTMEIIDNGQDNARLTKAIAEATFPVNVFSPSEPMGLAEAWNWFITNIREERFITNDDITFAPDSLEKMVAATASFVSCGFGFSCFLIRDACVEKVGVFDETISPGYAYFEDMDYLRRMRLADVCDAVVQCGVQHKQSATPEYFTDAEWTAHHQKFQRAASNYRTKWESDPSWEQLRGIGGAGVNS